MRRCAPPPDDRGPISALEVAFHLPVWLTSDQERRLHDLLDEVVSSPCNQPADGVHWVAEYGGRPTWSKADAALLGIETDPNAPATGGPSFDMTVYHVGTYARKFVSEEERTRVLVRRAERE